MINKAIGIVCESDGTCGKIECEGKLYFFKKDDIEKDQQLIINDEVTFFKEELSLIDEKYNVARFITKNNKSE